jgi:adenosine deaminase
MINRYSCIPKGDLHSHFNGSIPSEVFLKLIGSNYSKEFLASIGFESHKLLVNAECVSLKEYLQPWSYLRLVPKNKNDLFILLDSYFKALKNDNVKFVEIRHTIVYLAKACNIDYNVALSWLHEGILEYGRRYNIKAGIIVTIGRGNEAINHIQFLIDFLREKTFLEYVIGVDLAGDEGICVDKDLYKKFRSCKDDFGLGITIHAGEIGMASNIREAVEKYNADRIGHGTAARNDRSILELLNKNNVCIEVCPISNIRTGASSIAGGDSIGSFLEYDVPFVFCSDNAGIQNTKLSDDYNIASAKYPDFDLINDMFDKQKKYSFLRGLDEYTFHK